MGTEDYNSGMYAQVGIAVTTFPKKNVPVDSSIR